MTIATVTRASHRRSRLASRSGRPITASRERLANVAASVRSGRPNTGITRASRGRHTASGGRQTQRHLRQDHAVSVRSAVSQRSWQASRAERPTTGVTRARLTAVMASVTRGNTDHCRHAGRHSRRHAGVVSSVTRATPIVASRGGVTRTSPRASAEPERASGVTQRVMRGAGLRGPRATSFRARRLPDLRGADGSRRRRGPGATPPSQRASARCRR